MQFPPFEHAEFLDRAWRSGTAIDIGSSSFVGGSWRERGLPEIPTDFASHKVNLRADPEYIDAIARHMDTTPDRVFAAAGTSGGNLATMLWAFRPGCNMVVERPVYSQLAATAIGLGAEVRYVDRRPDEAWRLHPDDVAAACDDDTALIIFASPNNPTQAAASPDDLRAIAQIATQHDAYVLVDQVYRELSDDPIAAPLDERLITTAGFNKSWGLPGIRLGWLTAAPEMVEAIHLVHMQTIMAANTPMEPVGTALLAMTETCRGQLESRLEATHGIYRDWLHDTPAVEDPDFRHITAFPRIPVDDTAAWGERVAREDGLVAVPGEYFGRAGHVRIGLGGEPETLAQGLEVLARCLP